MLNEKSINKILLSKELMTKLSRQNTHLLEPGYLAKRCGTTGDINYELRKVASFIGAKSYLLKRQRSIINSGLIALSEIENG